MSHWASRSIHRTPEAFREFREDRDWTQAELADLMGVSANTIARWERGERTIPNIAHSWRWLYMEYEERC